MQIFRKFDGAQQEKLLRIAESVYPRKSDVLAAGKKRNGSLSAQDQADKNLWWWNDFDGVRLPYAITTSSVVYYRQKIRGFRSGDFSGSHGIKMIYAHMKYVADIAPLAEFNLNKTTFRDVYVVQMKLDWKQYCATSARWILAANASLC